MLSAPARDKGDHLPAKKIPAGIIFPTSPPARRCTLLAVLAGHLTTADGSAAPKRRDIVVVDNVPFHKVGGVEAAIQAVGASLRYLPKYSPDLNPIELLFHPLKTCLRKAAERTIEGLHRCVRSYIRALDPAECIGYFRHSGYEPL
jgi:transposase